MSTFENRDGTFFNETGAHPVRVTAPLTGTTVALKNTESDLYVNAAGTLAALTIKLCSKPEPGFEHDIASAFAVTALTVQTGLGAAITGAPATVAAGGSFVMRYVSKAVGWVKWR